MAKVDGKRLLIKIDDVVVESETSSSWSSQVDAIETTTKDSPGAAKEYIPGEIGHTCSSEGLYDPADTLGAEDIYDLLADRTIVTLAWGGAETGDEVRTAQAFAQSIDISGPKNEAASYTVNWQITGEVTKSTLT